MRSAPSKTCRRPCSREAHLLRSLGTSILLFARRKPWDGWIINFAGRLDCFIAFLLTRTVACPVLFPTHSNLLQIIITHQCMLWDWTSIPVLTPTVSAWDTRNSATESLMQ